jgi:hypothetical protein
MDAFLRIERAMVCRVVDQADTANACGPFQMRRQ